MDLLKMSQSLEMIHNRLSNIESNISKLDEKMDFSLTLLRNQLIKIKNNEELDDHNILLGRPYNELTPQRAEKIYSNENASFIIIDVSEKNHTPSIKLDGLVSIPLEELDSRYLEIHSKTIPLLIISEHGVRSILACELLVKKGFYNVNNIAGGYEFWSKLRSGSAATI